MLSDWLTAQQKWLMVSTMSVCEYSFALVFLVGLLLWSDSDSFQLQSAGSTSDSPSLGNDNMRAFSSLLVPL